MDKISVLTAQYEKPDIIRGKESVKVVFLNVVNQSREIVDTKRLSPKSRPLTSKVSWL